MSYEEEKRCPLCAEEMDWTDQQLKPCKCGYQVCVWCWHQIMDMAEKNGMDGRCPACRAPYDKDKIVGMEAKFERVVACNAKKHKPPKAKAKANEGKKDLTNIRVIQRRMAYVIGLPLSLADEDLLQRKDFFGQYGKVTKVSLSRTAGGAIQQFVNDTCSVYITFSKEEEAIRCIQSVHGFVLEGRFLRASFGTAKYCHAWLRNMPCNNSACLYLHSMGAEEDSFGKDEAAAVQTRSRVQQIVGATHNMHRCSGNALPPPIDESFNCNGASAEKPISKGVSKDASPDNEFSSVQSTYFASSKDKDGDARATNKMTTFVDIVGRSCNYGTEKDGNVAEDRGVENLRSELSSVAYNKDNNVGTAHTNAMLCSNFSSSSLPANGYPNNREFKEPFREPSNLWAVGRVDPIPSDEFIEQSGTTVSTEKQMLQDPSSVVREDLLPSDNGGLKDCRSVGQVGTSLPPSCPLTTSEDPRVYAWQDGESYNLGDYNVDLNTVNDYAPSVTCTRSMNDLYNEKKFQSSAKSDRIYRCSNSFSNEEIVEHLRRLDDHDSTIEAQNPALEAVESSIISNIMSLDLDAGDDSLNWQPAVAGLFGQTDDQHGSSWSRYNNDQSGLSFTKQHGFVSQPGDLDSSFTDIGQDFKKSSTPRESGENKHYSFKSGHHGLTPPGFSLPSREPPPGFPSCERTDQGFLSNSGSAMIKTSSFSKTHYRTPSTGNSSNTSDIDINDPAIMVVGRGKPPNGLTNSCFDTRSTQASQAGTFDDKARLWLLMQQSNQDLKYPQTYMQQVPAANQDLRYSGQTGGVYSSWNNMYGISSGYLDQLHTYNPSSFTPFSQQKFTNGSLSNSYQPGLNEMHVRNDRSTAELQRNEKLGLNNCYPGYGDYMLQQGSNDRYTRVFGM